MKQELKYNFVNQYGNGYYPAVNNPRIGGLPEIVSYSDCSNCKLQYESRKSEEKKT